MLHAIFIFFSAYLVVPYAKRWMDSSVYIERCSIVLFFGLLGGRTVYAVLCSCG